MEPFSPSSSLIELNDLGSSFVCSDTSDNQDKPHHSPEYAASDTPSSIDSGSQSNNSKSNCTNRSTSNSTINNESNAANNSNSNGTNNRNRHSNSDGTNNSSSHGTGYSTGSSINNISSVANSMNEGYRNTLGESDSTAPNTLGDTLSTNTDRTAQQEETQIHHQVGEGDRRSQGSTVYLRRFISILWRFFLIVESFTYHLMPIRLSRYIAFEYRRAIFCLYLLNSLLVIVRLLLGGPLITFGVSHSGTVRGMPRRHSYHPLDGDVYTLDMTDMFAGSLRYFHIISGVLSLILSLACHFGLPVILPFLLSRYIGRRRL